MGQDRFFTCLMILYIVGDVNVRILHHVVDKWAYYFIKKGGKARRDSKRAALFQSQPLCITSKNFFSLRAQSNPRRSRTTAPARIMPAVDGTKEMLPGLGRTSSLSVKGLWGTSVE